MVFNNLLKLSNQYTSFFHQEREYPTEEEMETKNETFYEGEGIFLGTTEKNAGDPVYLPYDGKSVGICVLAPKGAGKTIFIQNIVAQLCRGRQRYLFMPDPKGDGRILDKPQRNPFDLEFLKKYGQKPYNFTPFYLYPTYLGKEPPDPRYQKFVLSLYDFFSLDKPVATYLFNYMCQIGEGETAQFQIEDIVNNPNFDKAMERGEDLMYYIMREIIQQGREARGRKGEIRRSNQKLSKEEIKRLVDGLIHADSGKLLKRLTTHFKTGQLVGYKRNSIPMLLRKYGSLVLQTSQYANDDKMNALYVSAVLLSILGDRKKWIETNGRMGLINKPVVVWLAEADRIINRKSNNPAKTFFAGIGKQERARGISYILDTQSPELIDPVPIEQADYIAITRPDSDAYFKLIQNWGGLSKYFIKDVCMKLDYSREKPNQWILLTKNKQQPYIKFYASRSPIAMAEEEGVSEEAEEAYI